MEGEYCSKCAKLRLTVIQVPALLGHEFLSSSVINANGQANSCTNLSYLYQLLSGGKRKYDDKYTEQ